MRLLTPKANGTFITLTKMSLKIAINYYILHCANCKTSMYSKIKRKKKLSGIKKKKSPGREQESEAALDLVPLGTIVLPIAVLVSLALATAARQGRCCYCHQLASAPAWPSCYCRELVAALVSL
jgi:hypothetical protein